MTYGSTQLGKFWECPRKYYYEYVAKREPVFDGVPRPVGSAIHKAVETLELGGHTGQAMTRARATYTERLPEDWERNPLLTVKDLEKVEGGWKQVERVIEEYPWKPQWEETKLLETKHKILLGHAEYEGILDMLVLQNKRWWVRDTKTTSFDVATVAKAHKLRHQYVGYWLLAKDLTGEEPAGVIQDFIKKPRVYWRKDGTATVSGEAFHREPFNITPQMVDQFKAYFEFTTRMIEELEELTAHDSPQHARADWPMQTNSCMAWNRVCAFYDVCAWPERADQILAGDTFRDREER